MSLPSSVFSESNPIFRLGGEDRTANLLFNKRRFRSNKSGHTSIPGIFFSPESLVTWVVLCHWQCSFIGCWYSFNKNIVFCIFANSNTCNSDGEPLRAFNPALVHSVLCPSDEKLTNILVSSFFLGGGDCHQGSQGRKLQI